MDAGPIIGQAAVPVLASDTADTLADRVLAAEHVLYPQMLALVATGKVRVDGNQVQLARRWYCCRLTSPRCWSRHSPIGPVLNVPGSLTVVYYGPSAMLPHGQSETRGPEVNGEDGLPDDEPDKSSQFMRPSPLETSGFPPLC